MRWKRFLNDNTDRQVPQEPSIQELWRRLYELAQRQVQLDDDSRRVLYSHLWELYY